MPSYLPALVALLDAIDVQPGDVLNVTILHDEDCPLLARTGVCDCEPIVVAPRVRGHNRPISRAREAVV